MSERELEAKALYEETCGYGLPDRLQAAPSWDEITEDHRASYRRTVARIAVARPSAIERVEAGIYSVMDENNQLREENDRLRAMLRPRA